MVFVKHPPPNSHGHRRSKWWRSRSGSSASAAELCLLFGDLQSELEIKGDNAAVTGWDAHKQNFSFVYFDFGFTLSVFLTGGAGITRLSVAALPLTFPVTATV